MKIEFAFKFEMELGSTRRFRTPGRRNRYCPSWDVFGYFFDCPRVRLRRLYYSCQCVLFYFYYYHDWCECSTTHGYRCPLFCKVFAAVCWVCTVDTHLTYWHMGYAAVGLSADENRVGAASLFKSRLSIVLRDEDFLTVEWAMGKILGSQCTVKWVVL